MLRNAKWLQIAIFGIQNCTRFGCFTVSQFSTNLFCDEMNSSQNARATCNCAYSSIRNYIYHVYTLHLIIMLHYDIIVTPKNFMILIFPNLRILIFFVMSVFHNSYSMPVSPPASCTVLYTLHTLDTACSIESR